MKNDHFLTLAGAFLGFMCLALGIAMGLWLSDKIGTVAYAMALTASFITSWGTRWISERQHKRFIADMDAIEARHEAQVAQMKRDLGMSEARLQ